MSIKLKIATVFLCFLGVLLIGNHLVLEHVVIPSFEKLELAESERSARRVLRAIERETQTLAALAGDWGSWDDTYRFVAEPYDSYIESNLIPSTFDSLGINVLFIYDLEGRVVWGKVFDLDARKEISVPEFVTPRKAWPNALLYGSDRVEDFRGILETSRGVMLVASVPILRSTGEGPVRGTLVVGKFLSERVLNGIRNHLELWFDIRRVNASDETSKSDIGLSRLPGPGEIVTLDNADDSLVSYGVLPEIASDASWVIRAYTTRSRSALGRSTAMTALMMAAVAGIAIMLTLLVAIRSIVIRPLSQLRSRMAALAGGVERSASPFTDRNDEIGELSREFESLLDSLEVTAASLRENEERHRLLYDETPSMFFTVDEALRIRSANQFGAQAMGYTVDELEETAVQQLYVQSDRASFENHAAECFQHPDTLHRWELRKTRKGGDVLWVHETARVISDERSGQALLIVSEDVTESRRLSKELTFQATHDTLTELVNRREFEMRLQRMLGGAKSEGSEHALCYLDLDQFKVINDTCGHAAGDELLCQLSGELSRHIRKRDTLARLGGDEFAVLIEHCPLADAQRVANVLLRAVQHFRFQWKTTSFAVGVSIGVVPIDGTTGDVTDIMSAADAACYTAKDEGRNRIKFFRRDDRNLARRHSEMQWVARIQHALEEGRFQLYYQVIAPSIGPVDEGERFEVLLRMVDEVGEIVAPDTFLPAAERYGIVDKLDRWVVTEVLDWFTKHPLQLENIAMCSLNVSGRSMSDDGFLEFLIAAIEDASVPATKLCFEITETAAIEHLDDTARFMSRLKEVGCCFALDDFGSGVSSFAYLRQLPADVLKIDGLFIQNLLNDPADAAITKSINEVAHTLGKQTVAEFVESEAILTAVREIGVDFVQGFAVGNPSQLSDLPLWGRTKPNC